MDLYKKKPAVYTAYSKHYFFDKMQISAFCLEQGYIPLNPFTIFGYFMDDMVDRDIVVNGNNNLIYMADEVWTFGPIADGVFAEVRLANNLGKPVKHFSLGKRIDDIRPLNKEGLHFEEELLNKFHRCEIEKEFGICVISDCPADGAVCTEKTGSEDSALTQQNDTGTPDEMVERAIEKYRSVLLEFMTVKEEERRRIWGCDTINDALIMHPDRFIAMFSKNIPKAGEVWIRRDASRKQIAIILPYEDTRYSAVRY